MNALTCVEGHTKALTEMYRDQGRFPGGRDIYAKAWAIRGRGGSSRRDSLQ